MVKAPKKAFEQRNVTEIKDLDPLTINSDVTSYLLNLDSEVEALIVPEGLLSFKHNYSRTKNKNPRRIALNQPQSVEEAINNPIRPLTSQISSLDELCLDKRSENDIFYQSFSFFNPITKEVSAIPFSNLEKGLRIYINSEHIKQRFKRFGIEAKGELVSFNYKNFGKARFALMDVKIPSMRKAPRYNAILRMPFGGDQFQNLFAWCYKADFKITPLDKYQSHNKISGMNIISDHEIAGYFSVANQMFHDESLLGETSNSALYNSPFLVISKQVYDISKKIRNNVLIKKQDGELVKPREFEVDIMLCRVAKTLGFNDFLRNAKRDGLTKDYHPSFYNF